MNTLNEDLEAIKKVEETITANKVARFAYTDEAYSKDDAKGVSEYNVNKAQNIPTADASILKVNETVLDKGYRAQASSITRMLVNHFFGRVSYNLNKVNDNVSNLVNTILKYRGKANGFATLDENGRIPYSQLAESAMEYKGQWNAKTNTPTLVNGTGTKGDFYVVSVAGTQNLGSGDIQFFENDRIIYNGSVWSRLSAGDVKTVNNVSPANGNITLTGDNIQVSSKDSTSLSQLAELAMKYKGQWNAKTNTPTLVNGTGTKGDFYVVSVAGTQNLGSGDIQFFENDRIIYNGSVWSRLSAGDVKTVNNVSPANGNIALTGDNIQVSTDNDTLLSAPLTTERYSDHSVTVQKVNFTCKDVMAKTPRWLRFDFSATSHKTLKIVGDTHIRVGDTIVHFDTDTKFVFDGSLAPYNGGKDWYVFLDTEGTVTISTSKATSRSNQRRIGQFHTLCAAAGTGLLGTVATCYTYKGSNYLIKQYNEEEDPDFYKFYKKTLLNTSGGAGYCTGQVEHPLSNFKAQDILPESVWCLTFHPSCASYDGMVYDKDMDIAVDIYLQSGTSELTKSAYGAKHTVSRSQINHTDDMRYVGKRLLSDPEFTSIAAGSNELTVISTKGDATTVGGHSDTAGRRMISFIGCEECAGYLSQWLRDTSAAGNATWVISDNRGSFGQTYGTMYGMRAGGNWDDAGYVGSRCRYCNQITQANITSLGARGSASILRIV